MIIFLTLLLRGRNKEREKRGVRVEGKVGVEFRVGFKVRCKVKFKVRLRVMLG